MQGVSSCLLCGSCGYVRRVGTEINSIRCGGKHLYLLSCPCKTQESTHREDSRRALTGKTPGEHSQGGLQESAQGGLQENTHSEDSRRALTGKTSGEHSQGELQESTHREDSPLSLLECLTPLGKTSLASRLTAHHPGFSECCTLKHVS